VTATSGQGERGAARTGPPGLDLGRLRSYLDQARPGMVRADLRGDLLPGGRSNLTYLVTDGASRWVVRRPPLGHVLPTAHDMGREHRVMAALGQAGFPVPAMVLLCPEREVIGAPFFLMEYVEGVAYRDPAELDRLGPDRVRTLVRSLVDILADLHAVPPDSVGLADFGRPEGFNARQVRRWRRQLDDSHSREVPGIARLHARLAARVPAESTGTIVHGDYRLDNVLVGADDGIRAVLDWEMSTLGDPLGDLALMLVYAGRPMPSATGPDRAPLDVAGHPDLAELVARYAARSGRDVTDLRWYVAFATFKLAVILEGVHYRFVRGETVGDGFDQIGERVAPLVAQGHDALGES
jgi:aminoglycoside phosphotransferase (APT) family kinase protein